MSSHWEDRPQLDDRVTLPRKNVEWVEAIVKWTRYDYVAIYDYPTVNNSDTVLEIYKGDMVQVSKRYRRDDWCLVQAGHILGWVFLPDVRFIVHGARPHPRPRPNLSDETPTQPASRVAETITQPIPDVRPEPRAEEDDHKKNMVQRLIKFFKR